MDPTWEATICGSGGRSPHRSYLLMTDLADQMAFIFTTRTKSVKSGRHANESWDTDRKQSKMNLVNGVKWEIRLNSLPEKCNPINL